MVDIIIAYNSTGGIGLEGKIPWHCPEDLKIFKDKTNNSLLIVGRKTAESLPNLPGRTLFCLSQKEKLDSDRNNCRIFKNFHEAFTEGKKLNKKIFIAGGGQIYNLVLRDYSYFINNIHISHINNDTVCDTFFKIPPIVGWKIIERKQYNDFVHEVWTRGVHQEQQYLDLLDKILHKGIPRVGRNGETTSLFGEKLVFNLTEGFPLLTTKKMFFRGIVEELLFFLKGETNSKFLEEKGVNIWKGNTTREFLNNLGMKNREEGIMGPIYGYQWRFFNAKYDENTGKPLEKGIDQLEEVINTIRSDPYSRRILMTDFNPLQAKQGVLYPCHSIILQFYVSEGFLDMSCYNRSQDTFLGTPFNIASSALLLTLIANVTNLVPRYLHMNLGDVHIYKQHYNFVRDQISRCPYPLPKLLVKKQLKTLLDVESLKFDDFFLQDYQSYPVIKTEMVA
jgi:dihydrofolate reductase / thymidylate synthase